MAYIDARHMKLKIGSTFYGDMSKVEIVSEDKSDLTFGELQSGSTKVYSLELTILQDFATGSLWKTLYSAAGTDVSFTLAPYGNASPSAGQQHIQFTASVLEKPTIGGEADLEGRFSSDVSLKLVQDYVLDDGA